MSLMRDRNAVQRADRLPVAAALVERARLRERVFRIEMRESMHLVVDRRDAFETGADIVLGGHFAAGDPLGGLDRGERCQVAIGRHQFA